MTTESLNNYPWAQEPVSEATQLTPNAQLVIKVFDFGSTESVETIGIEQQHPFGADPVALQEDVDRDHRRRVDGGLEFQTIASAGFTGLLPRFKQFLAYSAMAQSLNFEYTQSQEHVDDTARTRIVIASPTNDTLNTVSNEAFPETVSFTLEDYPGLNYKLTELFQALSQHRVLSSKQLPYRLHEDVALHRLGWMLAGDNFVPSWMLDLVLAYADIVSSGDAGVINRRHIELEAANSALIRAGLAYDSMSTDIALGTLVAPDADIAPPELKKANGRRKYVADKIAMGFARQIVLAQSLGIMSTDVGYDMADPTKATNEILSRADALGQYLGISAD